MKTQIPQFVRLASSLLPWLLAFGCMNENNTIYIQEDSGDFFPSNPGSWWTYEVVRSQSGSSDTSEATVKVISRDTLSNGLAASRWQVVASDTTIARLVFYPVRGSSFYSRQSNDSVLFYSSLADSFPKVFLLLPLTIGRFWENDRGFFAYGSIVDSLSAKTLPVGSFADCIRIRGRGGWWQWPYDRSLWFKGSVGLIELSHSQPGMALPFTLKLRSYVLGKK